jgi:hypothetical protein
MPLTRILFDLGRVVATECALALLEASGEEPNLYLDRHVTGDWGEISSVDKAANMLALGIGDRLISSYRTSRGAKLLVATEADRSVTCLFLPEDY